MINSHKKIIAWNLLVIFTFSNIIPLNLWAVSSGPTQPEVETFQPIGTSGMVNKYTGDFNYNLPILSVPGPNGSYPVNLIYSAGASMYQEASWVGLGWNINPGSIKRHLNGIPDEFNGDNITHYDYEKKQSRRTETLDGEIGGSVGPKKGGYGANISAGASYSWIRDSYRGKGFIHGYHYGASIYARIKKVKPDLGINNSVSLSSFDGITSSFGVSVGASLALKGKFSSATLSTGINWSYNSKIGYKGTSFRSSIRQVHSQLSAEGIRAKRRVKKRLKESGGYDKLTYVEKLYHALDKELIAKERFAHRASIGSSFTNNDNVTSAISTHTMARAGKSNTWGLGLGVEFDVSEIIGFNASVSYTNTNSSSWPVHNQLSLSSYGYLNLGHATNPGAMDYATHNQMPLSLTTPQISYPKHAQDGFVVNGQGLSGFFQAKRKDVGLLRPSFSDGKIKHTSNELEVTLEAGSMTVLVSYNEYLNSYTRTTIDKWDDELLEELDYDFKQSLSSDNFYEPYSFLSTGEMTFRDEVDDADMFFNKEPIVFDLEEHDLSSSSVYRDQNLFKIKNTAPSFTMKDGRTMRNQYFEPIRFSEYKDIRSAYNTQKVSYLYEKNHYPDELPTQYEDLTDYVSTNHLHHFKEVQVYNVGGELYEYGIPVYNNSSSDITFSSNNLPLGTKVRDDIELGVDPLQGFQKSYKGSKIKNYAHSFLLTAIYSPDYVDITNNGPTEDDFGFWVKFNYSKVNDNFAWGSPALGKANYLPGYVNNTQDQYGSYQFGSKKLYYLNSIETKSHIAKFKISNRADCSSYSSTATVQKLDQIELYNKSEDIPLKTVHFEYDYSLCSGIQPFCPNNAASNEPGTGKLTLKSFYTTYKNNLKGRLSKYKFSYEHNPDFQFGYFDSWGVYKKENSSGPYLDQVPFPEQMDNSTEKEKRDLNASSWNLSSITLPSGGKMEIDYEMDDYLWVQDKKSMQMHEIIGLSSTSQLNENDVKVAGDIDGQYRVYFKLNIDDFSNVNLNAYMNDLVEGIDMLYFRTWMFYKKKTFDYAKGYAPISGNYGTIDYQGTKIGYIDLEPTSVYSSRMHNRKISHGNPVTVHPFQAEVLKQIQHYRSDLEYVSSEKEKKKQLKIELKKGFERMALEKKFGSKYAMIDLLPSFIRLNTANKAKYGGGHRVKSVRIVDNASDLGLETASYGKTYHYFDKDGNSSGVTGSEPFASKEESPFKLPKYYSSVFDYTRKNFNDKELYTDYNLAEPFFPTASVGYSRVLEESHAFDASGNIIQLDARVGDGIIEEEYYTSKDFPVQSKFELKKPVTSFKRPSLAPPIVSFYKKHNSYGYSQGLVVEVNDMAGKLKTISKYPYYPDITFNSFNSVTPVFEEIHHYKQLGNIPDSKVNVTTGGQKSLGVDIQTAIAIQQNRTYTQMEDKQRSVRFVGFLPIPVNVQYTNHRELDNAQSISSTKVISRNGVFDRKEIYSDQNRIVQINGKYEPISGQVSELIQTDEFNTEVVASTIKASSIYPKAQGKYLYDNLSFTSPIIANSGVPGSNDFAYVTINGSSDTHLKPGDKLLISKAGNKHIAYIDNITGASSTPNSWSANIELISYDGTSIASNDFTVYKVINPANTNQLTLDVYSKSTINGKVISAQATTLSDEWLDNGFEKEEIENYSLSTFPEVKYTNGQKGILRPDNVYSFIANRKYDNDTDKGSIDGFIDFDFNSPILTPGWLSPIRSSKYSPYGYGIESEDIRGVKSSAFYDYDKSLVTISAQNAAYKEIAFDAYEDYVNGDNNIKHGHVKWKMYDVLVDPAQGIYQNFNVKVSDEYSHTGKQSLKFVLEPTPVIARYEFVASLIDQTTGSGFWEFEENKKYVIQYWQKTVTEGDELPFLTTGTSNTLTLQNEIKVGDWVRKEYILETTNSSSVTLMFLKDKLDGGIFYVDDFRITPFNSTSQAFVYDAHTYDVSAILDQNNFASIYKYDEQGQLVITKRETVEGIKSISSNRSNVKR